MVKEKPDLSAFCLRAREFVAQGRARDALNLYGDVLGTDPDYALAYADRGTVYAMLEEHDLALADLKKAFALGYSEASAYCTAATVYSKLKEHKKSLEYFSKAITAGKDYPFIYRNRAEVFRETGDTGAAIADLEKYLGFGLDPEQKDRVLQRIRLLKAKRDDAS